MRRQLFTTAAPGRLVHAVDALGDQGLAFLPDLLPPKTDLGSKRLRQALSKADRELARLDGAARQIQRPDLLFRNYVRREAVLSSKIEGTHTTLADLVLFEAAGRVGNDRDKSEVQAYVDAFDYGRSICDEVPCGRTMFRELHRTLFGADASDKAPGEFRDCQVVIGQPPLSKARFVPPPSMFVDELIENLEQYLLTDDEPPLLKLATAHYQFETIHPFRDGNGRVGRLLISLELQRLKILTAPMLYLSAFFEAHRDEYYDSLLAVSTQGAWENWIAFFLEGVALQASDALRRTDRLVELRRNYHQMFDAPRISQKLHRLIDELFVVPAISVPLAAKSLEVTYAAAKSIVEKLIGARILGRTPAAVAGAKYYLARGIIRAVEGPIEEALQAG